MSKLPFDSSEICYLLKWKIPRRWNFYVIYQWKAIGSSVVPTAPHSGQLIKSMAQPIVFIVAPDQRGRG